MDVLFIVDTELKAGFDVDAVEALVSDVAQHGKLSADHIAKALKAFGSSSG
jgi:hypothetical protein